MRKLILLSFLACFASFSTFANDADLFNLDYNAVQTELAGLDQLSDMVAANADLTYTSLKLSNASMVNGLNLVAGMASPFSTFGEPLLGVPSFLWGCVFGPIGMVVVYIGTEEDKEETKKAMWGCIVSSASYTVVWIIYYVAVLSVVTI
jgi:hypothetical protein